MSAFRQKRTEPVRKHDAIGPEVEIVVIEVTLGSRGATQFIDAAKKPSAVHVAASWKRRSQLCQTPPFADILRSEKRSLNGCFRELPQRARILRRSQAHSCRSRCYERPDRYRAAEHFQDEGKHRSEMSTTAQMPAKALPPIRQRQ